MNLIITVLTFILLMSAITYQRIQTYADQQLLQTRWLKLIQETEICEMDAGASKLYSEITVAPKETTKAEEGKQPVTEKPDGVSTINFRWITNPSGQKNPELAPLFKEVVVSLIAKLFGDQTFYKGLDNPREIYSQILDSVTSANGVFEDKKKVSSAKKIANLNIGPGQQLLSDILAGYQTDDCKVVTLLTYLNNGRNEKIRPYLAPKKLLEVLFEEGAVDSILEERKNLFKSLDKTPPLGVDQAKQQFQGQFERYTKYGPILDWSVTKTDPSNYE